MFQLTPVVRVLLLVNVAVLLLQGSGFVPTDVFALHSFSSSLFRPWQLVTYMFMHGGWSHLFNNLLGLFFFGALLEQRWGGPRFATYYLLCGMGAGLLYNGIRGWEAHEMRVTAAQFTAAPDAVGFDRFTEKYGVSSYETDQVTMALKKQPSDAEVRQVAVSAVNDLTDYIITKSSMLGASGAVFGILFAFGYLFPNTQMFLFPLPITIQAKYFVLLYGAYELFSGVHRAAGDNVAHFAHVGGMLIGFLILKYWEKRHPDFY